MLMFCNRVASYAHCLRKMSTTVSTAVLARIEQKSNEAEHLTRVLRAQINSLRQTAVTGACMIEEERLRQENAVLRKEVEKLKAKLVQLEVHNGVKQVPMPTSTTSTTALSSPASPTPISDTSVDRERLATENIKQAAQPVVTKLKEDGSATTLATEAKATKKPEGGKKQSTQADAGKKQSPGQGEAGKKQAAQKEQGKKEGAGSKTEPAAGAAAVAADGAVDASKLNMRIGLITSAKRHPDADSLYVEEVDVGEAKPRTIVSGLVKHVPLEEMQQRYAVFLLNLKPAKMRGIMSEGMIMCASTPEKVEIIRPPQGVAPGQRVIVDNYPGPPDDQLNPKKKVWEQIQPDLRINGEGVATYKGSLWRIEGKPDTSFSVPSLKDCPIK